MLRTTEEGWGKGSAQESTGTPSDWESDDTVPLTQRRRSLGRKGRFSFRDETFQAIEAIHREAIHREMSSSQLKTLFITEQSLQNN